LEQQPLKNAVLQGFILKNRKSLQAQAWSKTVRFSTQSISFGTGSINKNYEYKVAGQAKLVSQKLKFWESLCCRSYFSRSLE
jgi:hypothetical protein